MRIRIWSHSVVILSAMLWITGCTDPNSGKDKKESSTAKQTDKAKADKADHHENGHEHGDGPHDGTLADWGGGKYHVEFVVDHDKKEATVYILGSDEKTPTPIKATEIQLSIKSPAFQVALKAAPQKGDPEGSSSQFVGTHENLGKVQEFSGTITGEIEGTPFTGEFAEEPHEHAEHK
ncbi:MAG: hypothetical protein WD648_13580 [Planctomycetaceae bacterium]